MPDGPPTRSALVLPTQRVLAAEENIWAGRDAVEDYLARLNQSSQVATRRVHHWERREDGAMGLSSVLLQSDQDADAPFGKVQELDAFMGEFRGSFGIEMVGGDLDAAPAAYMIGLPLAGAVTVTTKGQVCTARAGEGIIVDPAEVRSSRLTPGMHFLEFCLPKSDVARLAGDWRPEAHPHQPRFAPHLSEGLARRLLFMATQAAEMLLPTQAGPGSRMMFRRWCEMIALTLLHEQRSDDAGAARGTSVEATPASVKRAVEYIHAHADSDIGLADIAAAACLSVSSLLRHFNARLGMSPYMCLKTVRLDRARSDLLHDTPDMVRDIALRWGFQNASKFSQAYRVRFGELPSETRVRREAV